MRTLMAAVRVSLPPTSDKVGAGLSRRGAIDRDDRARGGAVNRHDACLKPHCDLPTRWNAKALRPA